MARSRLICLLVAVGLGAAGLVPASAASSSGRPTPPDPVRALHAATVGLAAGPSEPALTSWHRALMRAAVPAATSTESASAADGPQEWAALYEAGDVDGDRHSDLVVMREGATLVRSGRDGRLLIRREGSGLIPVSGAGAVKLVALDVEFAEDDNGYTVDVLLTGLDRTGRGLWQHALSGSIEVYGIGPAYAGRFDAFPAMLYGDRLDADGRPALMLGTLTGAHGGPAGAATRMDLSLLSMADGSSSPLPPVQGAGDGVPWAFPYETTPGSCHTATAPVGALTAASLVCGGTSRWTRLVELSDPNVLPAGDFDGDRAGDLMLSTYSYYEDEGSGPGAAGTRVLAYGSGQELGASDVDGLTPIGGDVSGDGEPDFLQLDYAEMGFGIRGLTLAGDELWSRWVQLRESGSLEAHAGLDVTGDGLGDGFVRAEPERGAPVALVIDARGGRTTTVSGVDALVVPGLRARGADLAVLEPVHGRLRARVLSGDRGRTLLDTRLPGPGGTPAHGGVAAADLDGDGRRDLVVAARTADRRTVTAVSATGRVLWQQSERAPRGVPGSPGVIVVGGGR